MRRRPVQTAFTLSPACRAPAPLCCPPCYGRIRAFPPASAALCAIWSARCWPRPASAANGRRSSTTTSASGCWLGRSTPIITRPHPDGDLRHHPRLDDQLPALVELFPEAKVVCCVRNPAWILEQHREPHPPQRVRLSGIFNFDSGGTVYSRVEGLASAIGMFGFAYNALREAIYGPQSDRLLLVRYETLTANPLTTLAAIYDFVGEELYPHDPHRIEPRYDMVEFVHAAWHAWPARRRPHGRGPRAQTRSCRPTCSCATRGTHSGTTWVPSRPR